MLRNITNPPKRVYSHYRKTENWGLLDPLLMSIYKALDVYTEIQRSFLPTPGAPAHNL